MKISLDEPEKPIEKSVDFEEEQAIKKTFAGEKKKLSQMTLGGKISYIWAYYKAPIIGVILVGLLIGYFVDAQLHRKTPTLTGIGINLIMGQNENYAAHLGEYMQLQPKESTVLIDGINLSDGATANLTTQNFSGATQILSMTTTRELDYTFSDLKGLQYMDQNELLRKLDEFLPEKIYKAFEDRLYTVKDGVCEGPIAIDMTGTKLAAALRFNNLYYPEDKNIYLSFQNLSEHEREMQLFLEYLYEFEFGETPLTFGAD